MGKADRGVENSPGDMPSLEEFDYDDDTDDNGDASLFEDRDEEDDGEGKSEMLSKEEYDILAVRETVFKVCLKISVFLFYLVPSGPVRSGPVFYCLFRKTGTVTGP